LNSLVSLTYFSYLLPTHARGLIVSPVTY